MTGTTCVACGTTQVIKENGNYFLGNNIAAEITGTIELCVICEIAGVPEKDGE
jgi:ssDNA-binding Zn-finger/Zn-ribbon topoisomerase 1